MNLSSHHALHCDPVTIQINEKTLTWALDHVPTQHCYALLKNCCIPLMPENIPLLFFEKKDRDKSTLVNISEAFSHSQIKDDSEGQRIFHLYAPSPKYSLS